MGSFRISMEKKDELIKYLVNLKYSEKQMIDLKNRITNRVVTEHNASLPKGIEKYNDYLVKSSIIKIRLPKDKFYRQDLMYYPSSLDLTSSDQFVVLSGAYMLSKHYETMTEEDQNLIKEYFGFLNDRFNLMQEVKQVVMGLNTSKQLLNSFPELESAFNWLRSNQTNALVDTTKINDVRTKLGLD